MNNIWVYVAFWGVPFVLGILISILLKKNKWALLWGTVPGIILFIFFLISSINGQMLTDKFSMRGLMLKVMDFSLILLAALAGSLIGKVLKGHHD